MPCLLSTAAELDTGEILMGLLGGLSLFLFGMGTMTDAVKAVAGTGMRKLLARATGNRFRAAFTGAAVTAVIQSSSVTTVLVVGFVSAGLVTLSQSVGVIMGANVGSTVTAQIIAFDVTDYALAMIAVGYFAPFLWRRERPRLVSAALLGIGLLFFGMEMMSRATVPLRDYAPFIALMQRLENPLFAILVGMVFTAIIQSSAATTGIVIVLAAKGLLSLETGIGLALGANVGTCATALLASIGRPRAAVRAALVHVLFNVAGALLWVGLIDQLAEVARAISPESPALGGTLKLAADTPRQIANAHTIFNVANTLLFIWFTGPIARLVTRLVPDRPGTPETIRPKYLDESQLFAPQVALGSLHLEICRLGVLARDTVANALPVTLSGNEREMREIELAEDRIDRLYDPIIEFVRQLSQKPLSVEQTRALARNLSVVNHLENIGDTVANDLLSLGRERLRTGLRVSPATERMLEPMHAAIVRAYDLVIEALGTWDEEEAQRVVDMKAEMKRLSAAAKDHLAARLAAEDPHRLKAFRLESDAVEYMKHLFYFTRRIAKVITGQKDREREALE